MWVSPSVTTADAAPIHPPATHGSDMLPMVTSPSIVLSQITDYVLR